MNRPGHYLGISEKALAIAAMSLMAVLPVAELMRATRRDQWRPGVDGFRAASDFVGGLPGRGAGGASDRLLALSANTFLPEKWAAPVRVVACGRDGGDRRGPLLGQL